MKVRLHLLISAVVVCSLPFLSVAQAQTLDYSLFDPAPDAALRPFCTDRPTKGTGPCTVDAGHLQIESYVFNATLQNSDGVVTDTYLYTNPNLKLGITEDLDVELNVSPYVEIVAHDHRSGERSDIAGFGDMFLRVKTSLVGNGQGPFSAALDPYLKLPTAAPGIGNRAVEGGLVLPLQFALSDVWSLSLAPEGDVLKNNLDDGRHAAGAAALGITGTINSQISASAEVWAAVNSDPSGTGTQDSFDVAATWQPPSFGAPGLT